MSQCPNCNECVHLNVTWDTKFPKGCGHFGFKSRQMPSVEVLTSTGRQCNAFTPLRVSQSSGYSTTTKPEYSTISLLG